MSFWLASCAPFFGGDLDRRETFGLVDKEA